jgi:hypothetical protein
VSSGEDLLADQIELAEIQIGIGHTPSCLQTSSPQSLSRLVSRVIFRVKPYYSTAATAASATELGESSADCCVGCS